MRTVAVPYHLDERLTALDVGTPIECEVTASLPAGTPWQRMATLYDEVARVVSADSRPPLVFSGDCTTSLGVLAGLQRAGRDPGIVWLDAHADFHTGTSTTSGYLGGMPLALAVGVGELTLPAALGLRPVAESRAVLVDARDTDPAEHLLLDQSAVTRTSVKDLRDKVIPAGDLYLHVDIDVCDPQDVPDLLYPAPGGAAVSDILASIERVVATGRVVGVGFAATWQAGPGSGATRHRVVRRVLEALSS